MDSAANAGALSELHDEDDGGDDDDDDDDRSCEVDTDTRTYMHVYICTHAYTYADITTFFVVCSGSRSFRHQDLLKAYSLLYRKTARHGQEQVPYTCRV